MKKNLIPAAAVAAAVALVSLGGLSSCKSDKAKQAEQEVTENVTETETAVVAEEVSPYGASFFNNPENKAESPSDSTYIETPSGLKYVVITEGTGVSPKKTDTVTVHYEGIMTDGTPFDSSYKRGEAATFPLDGVIAGWTEGLQTMKTGGKTIFYIPSDLAYGERGVPGVIPGNAPLIFTVELFEVN